MERLHGGARSEVSLKESAPPSTSVVAVTTPALVVAEEAGERPVSSQGETPEDPESGASQAIQVIPVSDVIMTSVDESEKASEPAQVLVDATPESMEHDQFSAMRVERDGGSEPGEASYLGGSSLLHGGSSEGGDGSLTGASSLLLGDADVRSTPEADGGGE